MLFAAGTLPYQSAIAVAFESAIFHADLYLLNFKCCMSCFFFKLKQLGTGTRGFVKFWIRFGKCFDLDWFAQDKKMRNFT
jgi:hypothetical protein